MTKHSICHDYLKEALHVEEMLKKSALIMYYHNKINYITLI